MALNFSCSATSSSSRRSTSFCSFCTDLFQLHRQVLDVLLVGLLPLVGLLLCHLEGLQVVGDHPQFFLQLHDMCLPSLSSFLSPLKIGLTLDQLLGDLLVGGVRVLGRSAGSLQVGLQLHHLLLVLLSFVLQHLLHPLGIIGSSGGFVKFLVCHQKLLLCLFQIFLETRNS